jgi:hypothetical protein
VAIEFTLVSNEDGDILKKLSCEEGVGEPGVKSLLLPCFRIKRGFYPDHLPAERSWIVGTEVRVFSSQTYWLPAGENAIFPAGSLFKL